MKKLSFLTLVAAALNAVPPAPPGPDHGSWGNQVYFYTQGAQGTVQADVDAVFATNGGSSGEFVNQGYAFLFAPGNYTGLDLKIGYYTSIMGLGATPLDTDISSVNSYSDSIVYCIGSTRNYWRSAENFSTTPAQPIHTINPTTGMTWAASHGSSLRNIIVNGRLYLSEFGAATGAFAANCVFQNNSDPNPEQGSAVYSGSQQQLLIRNTNLLAAASPAWNLDSAAGFAWAQAFVGCTGDVPASHCGNCNGGQIPGEFFVAATTPRLRTELGCTCANNLCDPSSPLSGCNEAVPITNVLSTPKIAEKPFITCDAAGSQGSFALFIPAVTLAPTIGANLSPAGESVPFSDVYVATPADTADTINSNLQTYRAVILTPGIYNLSAPIVISQNDKVLLGIGYPILIPTAQTECIQVKNVTGTRIAGLILQAGPPTLTHSSNTLLSWGNFASGATDGFLYDCFARVGQFGAALDPENSVKTMFQIYGSNVICDNVWAWRADVDAIGPISTRLFPVATCPIGIQVYANNTIAYGLSCENTNDRNAAQFANRNLLEWFGEDGQCYSYQGAYSPDTIATVGSNYEAAGYLVGTNVHRHLAYDVGIYSRIVTPTIVVNAGIIVPDVPQGIAFFNAFTRILEGGGTIFSVINGTGGTGGGSTSGFASQSFANKDFPGPTYIQSCEYGETLVKTAFPYK